MRVVNAAGEPLVLVERRDHVGVLVLNRPEVRNAVNEAMTAAISGAIEALEADEDVWVLIITGAGDRAFCAGQDLKAMPSTSSAGESTTPPSGGWAGLADRLFSKPVIAAVNGFALGGGTEICLNVDCIVADEHARFGLPEVKRGIVAGAGGLQRLPRRIPPALAMELIFTGRAISAQRALELGLVNRVVPSGTCVEAAMELAEEICQAAPISVRYSKAVARASIALGEREAVEAGQDLRQVLYGSQDRAEGLRAFREKRDPVWRNR